MENSLQLATRFREVLLDGKWIANTNLRDQLSDLNWTEATKKVSSLNTIAALSYHLNYYIAGVLQVFEGGALEIRDKYSFDLPPIESNEAWEKLLNTLWSNAERFAAQVELMSNPQLAAAFVDPKYGNYRRNIEGMIEHCYYHLGQIVLIKKMIRAGGVTSF
ncbi:hypothetical protein [Haliscomenobacter hydrossis]|uniref:DinB-like domain-containing protein n=1 Tax=Haliscomenobacter hydrossis (strain ATCC 27775 / DSM 1100 / LMG 10767 / O) TaxID=760192 RepID=F4KWH9_HALH1|nr:hypothetical protein [Haliscomenobacter hydrossis]AEE51319.1 hypothetical protein Halhy_3463 [Haliscomenobacter hydrossis DSM 1100]